VDHPGRAELRAALKLGQAPDQRALQILPVSQHQSYCLVALRPPRTAEPILAWEVLAAVPAEVVALLLSTAGARALEEEQEREEPEAGPVCGSLPLQ
jgi:hypothetical protein